MLKRLVIFGLFVSNFFANNKVLSDAAKELLTANEFAILQNNQDIKLIFIDKELSTSLQEVKKYLSANVQQASVYISIKIVSNSNLRISCGINLILLFNKL